MGRGSIVIDLDDEACYTNDAYWRANVQEDTTYRPVEGKRKSRSELEAELDYAHSMNKEMDALNDHLSNRAEMMLEQIRRLQEANRGMRRGMDRLHRRIARMTNGNQIGQD